MLSGTLISILFCYPLSCLFLVTTNQALEGLLKSEEAVKQAKGALSSAGSGDLKQEISQHWWTPGLEYDILLADLMIFQSILHFMAETISEYVRTSVTQFLDFILTII